MKTETIIITHRTLEPGNPEFKWSESSYQGFADQLKRGFSIEFDPNFVKDGVIIAHDTTLKRITRGKDERPFLELTVGEALTLPLDHGRLCTFAEIMELIRASESQMNALHLKGKFQEPHYLDNLFEQLAPYQDMFSRMMIFDVNPVTARYLKARNSALVLAPSVAHPYDIERYNSAVLGTLITIEEAIAGKNEGIFDWVWGDEWDLVGPDGTKKTLYNAENFRRLHEAGLKISLVTPELHATSPGLLGGEAHPDGVDKEKLFRRIEEILSLGPDAICTDYPKDAQAMLQKTS